MIRRNNFKNYILVLNVLLLLSSCVKDFTIDMPANPNNIVLNAVFTVDSMPKIIITKERVITDGTINNYYNMLTQINPVFTPITTASISLYEDDKLLTQTFTYNATNGYYYNPSIKCKANAKYKIEASAPGLISSSAVYQAPEKLLAQVIETKKYSQSQYFPGGIYRNMYSEESYSRYVDSVIIIKIRIPAYNTKKCFMVSSIYSTSDKIEDLANQYQYSEFINLISPTNLKQENEDFFTDINEINNSYHINYPSYNYLMFTNQNYIDKEMLIEVILVKSNYRSLYQNSVVSLDMYQIETLDYVRTLSINAKNSGEELILGITEPTLIKTNTSNGLGYFAIKSNSKVSVIY